MTSPRRAEKLKALPTKRGLKSDSAASPGISRGEAQFIYCTDLLIYSPTDWRNVVMSVVFPCFDFDGTTDSFRRYSY